MRRWMAIMFVIVSFLPASAAKKDAGTTTLKDVQPAGTPNSKDKQKQQYDFSFDSPTHRYTCRTGEKTKINAVDFVVGSDVKYEVDGSNGKLKTTEGKQVKCTLVLVEKNAAGGESQAAPAAPKGH